MKRKILFFAVFCFLIAVFAAVPVSASESDSGNYIFNLNDGNIFISKSPSSDYKSMGDFLIVNYGSGEVMDLIPAEANILIIGNNLPTTNQIIVNGSGLSKQTIICLILNDIVWDKNKALSDNKSEIINTLNNTMVKMVYDRNNSVLVSPDTMIYFENGTIMYFNAEEFETENQPVVLRGGPIKISGFEIEEDGTVNIGSFRVEKNIVRIGVIQIDENGVHLNNESDYVREFVPALNYLISIFIYFF
ncbi:hypothetical protein [Methanimicrococcus blatticola]|uniref:Uncharacterized protein n=1 Tax=Methanimicrococcus blatticola TaxID=91560 RepID=A0A484F4R3_9EURY|nr:hypothetical protein [Methanimicrococcus blatticola]MBZ3936167.1 hypothetical protein [Methanimicrococcus blatticola]MCC2508410.1 hypothetical protein [Methanimicrococcus blatticola]TDQ70137.1 hypothetical protein C7391_0476 [Methanimicrococcus blatticola]